MKTTYIILFFLMVIVSLTGMLSSKNSLDITQADISAKNFVNYVLAFDEYLLSHDVINGDVTNDVVIPTWLPVNSEIKMIISAGYGYIFMPSSPGMLANVQQITGNSAMVGVSDSASISTPLGAIAKPAFIPSGYIVYVR
ncbi:oxidoreductase (plasmid) [Candidatus Symbiopectobacterium sp. 'North America']|uniref:type IV pilus biogenesis protein PilM n=1 Tax=Candidatus Symbiopectobacterium sp. 'North America' TaxID=2794574 RepID=UPI0018C984BC|nr:type IV pilus biogenesis protein PilM [Candidatus Symbiopectobacterium sp. 'North America']MBG6246671.1 oxidoreductase [Candidatus Symbiopectobacterium sp. 'North America']